MQLNFYTSLLHKVGAWVRTCSVVAESPIIFPLRTSIDLYLGFETFAGDSFPAPNTRLSL